MCCCLLCELQPSLFIFPEYLILAVSRMYDYLSDVRGLLGMYVIDLPSAIVAVPAKVSYTVNCLQKLSDCSFRFVRMLPVQSQIMAQ